MTEELRPPPYPADTLARGWRFEVDMEKVKRSDTWKLAKTGPIRGALLLLWAEAWGESPCGTLPNDDQLIALTIDMPAATFTKHRAVLMRGWWLASDGRLYHETITERVLAMLDKRATDAQRAANYRARKAAATGDPDGVTGASRVTNAGLQGEFDTKHQAPRTNTSPRTGESARASRLPKPFELPEDWRQFCLTERPDLNPDVVAAKFADYWHGKPGKAGTKLDWLATWRNWVREERAASRTNGSGTAYQQHQQQRVAEFAPALAKRTAGQQTIIEETPHVPAIAGR